jgi:hypothetical protein
MGVSLSPLLQLWQPRAAALPKDSRNICAIGIEEKSSVLSTSLQPHSEQSSEYRPEIRSFEIIGRTQKTSPLGLGIWTLFQQHCADSQTYWQPGSAEQLRVDEQTGIALIES